MLARMSPTPSIQTSTRMTRYARLVLLIPPCLMIIIADRPTRIGKRTKGGRGRKFSSNFRALTLSVLGWARQVSYS